MNRQEAVRIIEETFKNPFNEERFRYFIRNLVNESEELYEQSIAGNYIPAAFKDHVKQYKRIAKYTDAEGEKIDVLAIGLHKVETLERARTKQRNFVADYLKRRGEKDAALVAYYTEGIEDWRFSYVRMDYHTELSEGGKVKVKTDLTPARRYSFLVGKHEPSHTAQQQLIPLLQDTENNPTLSQIEQAFNIETVTNEFFEYYKKLFIQLRDHIEKEFKKSKQLQEELTAKGIDAVSSSKKLLGQIVFLYFIQKKGWLGVPKDQTWGKGDRQFLRTLLQQAIESKKNFYSDVLEYLFYEALAVEHRGGSDASYYPHFDCKIPFLNGGLFEADYDWKKREVSIPNTFFTNNNKTDKGDIGDGILDVFDRYNFTVREDEPLDKEIALDPELLGKTFERMLEVKDRKSKGTYYTPREIVHYMCEESLINYLDVTLNEQPASYSKLGEQQTDAFGNKVKKGQLDIEAEVGAIVKVPRSEIEEFIRHGIAAIENDARVESKGRETKTYSYQLPPSIRTYAKEIDKALETIRICDPAIGSGAFPVGMMGEIVQARYILEHTYLRKGQTSYDFKRHAIQECIYGVDIDHSAIDIAKLRLWLSLVVDEEDFYKIKPLPNLDYKIVEGNSLIGLPQNVLRDPKIEDEIEELKQKFFDETDNEKKKILRENINTKIQQLLSSAKDFSGYHVNFDFRLFFSEVFHKKLGFDITIGNPPYGADFSNQEIKFYREHYDSAKTIPGRLKGSLDSFSLFIDRGLQLCNRASTLSYIVPLAFTSSEAMASLHNIIFSCCENISISTYSNRPNKIFESADQRVSIIVLNKRNKAIKKVLTTKLNKRYSETTIQEMIDNLQFVDSRDFLLKGRIPKVGTEIELSILSKLFLIPTKLSEFLVEKGKEVYYRAAGGRYYNVVTTYRTGSTQEKSLKVKKEYHSIIAAILSTNLYWWFLHAYSDTLHIKSFELESFPIPVDRLDSKSILNIERIYNEYLKDLEKNVRTIQADYNTVSSFKEYRARKSKHLIDQIDYAIKDVYGLSEKEIEFIINYDLEFRTDEQDD